MSNVLYYSRYCEYCNQLIEKLSKTKTKDEMHFICIDNREKHIDGTMYVVLDNGQKILFPPSITEVPSILLLHHGNRILKGMQEILHYLKPGETEINNIATSFNGEPNAFSFSEMGSNLSDNYSYLDTPAEELMATGNGGLRMMHNYCTIDDNQAISTPPDDYEPDKVGQVDLGKLQMSRAAEIKQNK
jgi:hypothetical protein